MRRVDKIMAEARRSGKADAAQGIPPDPCYITNGYGSAWRHYQAWRNAYDAGYFEELYRRVKS